MRGLALKSAVRFAFFALVMLLALVILFHYIGSNLRGEANRDVMADSPKKTVVLDAGHGGIDGGAVSLDGAEEKDYNLSITLILRELFLSAGYNVILTREEDVMLTTDGGGNAKTRDLKARLLIAKQHEDALFISIHCNKFPQESCKGLQVYYSTNDARSKSFADSVQSTVTAVLQNDNHRKTKPATSSIYLMYRSEQPSILIECGFLSNSEESRKLGELSYQKELALAIFYGICSTELS